MNPVLLELWRERHPEAKEQLFFNFSNSNPSAEMGYLFNEKQERTREEDTRDLVE
jgi:hypothetical protein